MSVECPLASSLVLPSLLLSYFLTSDDWDWNPQRHLGKWDDSDGLGTSTETLGGSVASHPEAGVLVSRRRVRKRDGKEKSSKLQNLDGLFCAFFFLIFYLFPSTETNGGKEKTEDCHEAVRQAHRFAHTHTLSGRVWFLVCASAAELGMDIESSVAIRHRMMIIARTDTSLNTTF